MGIKGRVEEILAFACDEGKFEVCWRGTWVWEVCVLGVGIILTYVDVSEVVELFGADQVEQLPRRGSKIAEESETCSCCRVCCHIEGLEIVMGSPLTEGSEPQARSPDRGEKEDSTSSLAICRFGVEVLRGKAGVQVEVLEVSRWFLKNCGRRSWGLIWMDGDRISNFIPWRFVH